MKKEQSENKVFFVICPYIINSNYKPRLAPSCVVLQRHNSTISGQLSHGALLYLADVECVILEDCPPRETVSSASAWTLQADSGGQVGQR